MFNGMMDPELMRIAQEQMSRIPPEELARIQQQMMSNPDLLQMATESMKNMRPEDLKQAAEQLKHVRPDEMAEISEKIAKASPEDLAAMKARADAQLSYQLNAARMLKQQGNDLHASGQFREAADKYMRAKKNLMDLPDAKCRILQVQCSLNLMSCHLKLQQLDDCVKEGSEVLQYDLNNAKALYRRAQAYRELGKLEAAVSDLKKAHEASPNDETIAEVLRETEEKLMESGLESIPRGVLIEEIVENSSAPSNHQMNYRESFVELPEEAATETIEVAESSRKVSSSRVDHDNSEAEYMQTLGKNPDTARSFQEYISNADPNSLAALGAGGISPDMIKTATSMIGTMKPEELQRMLQQAASLNGKNPGMGNGPSASGSKFPEVTPEMSKIASEMIGKMSPEELTRMMEVASSFRPEQVTGQRVGNGPSPASTFSSRFPNSGDVSTSTGDLQEQMRSTMNDPAMRQMFSSMVRNMSPEMMSSMSEQFGVKMTKDDATKAQRAFSSMSPEDLDRMMRWAERAQRGIEVARKTKDFFLGKRGMVMAIGMLILAFIFHQLGFIGS